MRTRSGYHAYHMRRWLRLLRRSRSLSSYPLPISMLTPGGINHNKSWTTTYITRNCMPSLKSSRFGGTIWKVWPIPLTLLQIIRTLSIFLLPRYWPGDKCSGPSTFPSSILSSGSALVVLAQNWMLSLNNGMSILKGGILAMPQSTLTTSNLSSLKNNLQPPYKLLFFFFLPST